MSVYVCSMGYAPGTWRESEGRQAIDFITVSSPQDKTPLTDMLSHFWGPGSHLPLFPFLSPLLTASLSCFQGPLLSSPPTFTTPPLCRSFLLPPQELMSMEYASLQSPSLDKSLCSLLSALSMATTKYLPTPHPLLSPSSALSSDLELYNPSSYFVSASYCVNLSNT